ncbi:MAG TPA: hypothetical protein VH595_02535 [Verrucomicrobiae bacterium]|nr:hypothetical protein [Verrucomicrobiae bacterium]
MMLTTTNAASANERPFDEHGNIRVSVGCGCRWRAAPGESSRLRGATDRRALFAPNGEAGTYWQDAGQSRKAD